MRSFNKQKSKLKPKPHRQSASNQHRQSLLFFRFGPNRVELENEHENTSNTANLRDQLLTAVSLDRHGEVVPGPGHVVILEHRDGEVELVDVRDVLLFFALVQKQVSD